MAGALQFLVPVRLAAVVVVSLVTAAAGEARADRELTEWSPSVLDANEVRVGPGTVGIGLFDRVEIDTHPIVYGALAAGGSAFDASVKVEVLRSGPFAASVGAGITTLSLGGEGSPDAVDQDTLALRVIPLEAWVAMKPVDSLRLTAGMVYADVSASGHTTMDVGRLTGFGGTFTGSNAEIYASAQVRLGRGFHLIGGFRALAWQDDAIDMTGEAEQGSRTMSATNQLAAEGAWAVSAALHLAEKHFNLRLGVEYGNYHVPLVDLVAPQKGFAPVIDVYWRI